MKTQILKNAVIAALASMLVFTGASASFAASKVTVDLPNDPVAGGETVNIPMFLTDFAFTDLSVTLVVEAGTLTVANDASTLTLNPGYADLAAQTEVSFHGAAADVVSAMETGVSWTAPGDATSTSELSIRVQVGEYQTGTTYDPATGHTYKFVSDKLSWSAAMAAAKAMTYKGKSGYLTNITSDEENTFVANKSGASNVWFGATSDQTFVGEARTAGGKPAVIGDPQLTGTFYWYGGTEAGTNFSTGKVTPTAVDGLYNSWAPQEPNNWSGIEGCGLTNWEGVAGKWNDFECATSQSYLVEFDTTPSDFETAVVTFDNITGEGTDAVPAVEDTVVPETTDTPSPELAETGFDAALLLALALALVAAGSVVVVRARKN
ncbi:MAG: hypothetical protein EBT65_06310 [Actinobacteria bacterium]|nr:hypothetical protein [Actinomycetota bacterium]